MSVPSADCCCVTQTSNTTNFGWHARSSIVQVVAQERLAGAPGQPLDGSDEVLAHRVLKAETGPA